MRTNTEEFEKLGREFARRINAAKGPVRVLVPLEGFSEHTSAARTIFAATTAAPGNSPEDYRAFVNCPQTAISRPRSIDELPLHINDSGFADACVDAFVEIAAERKKWALTQDLSSRTASEARRSGNHES